MTPYQRSRLAYLSSKSAAALTLDQMFEMLELGELFDEERIRDRAAHQPNAGGER